MASNRSVERFRRLMEALPDRVAKAAMDQSVANGQALAAAMRAAAPKDTGTLAGTIRVEVQRQKYRVRVKAGGKATQSKTRRGAAAAFRQGLIEGIKGGKNYDYSRGVEFGNIQTHAQPFFWTTYRRMRRGLRKQLVDRIAKTLKEEFGG